MAVLTADHLCEIRRSLAREAPIVNYTKSSVNAAVQAIEDWFEANRASLGAAINNGTTPFVFTAPQKTALVKFWLLHKYQQGG